MAECPAPHGSEAGRRYREVERRGRSEGVGGDEDSRRSDKYEEVRIVTGFKVTKNVEDDARFNWESVKLMQYWELCYRRGIR